MELTALFTDYRGGWDHSTAAVSKGKVYKLVEERRNLMLEMMKEDPGAALRFSLPESLHEYMPPETYKLLERSVEFEGEMEVMHVVYDDASEHQYQYSVLTDEGRFSLHFSGKSPDVKTGERVRIKGLMLEESGNDGLSNKGAIALLENDGFEKLAEADRIESRASTSSAPELSDTVGAQNTLVFLVNFPDQPMQPWTVQQARDLVFGEASDFFDENSYGQTSLEGDVFGWATLPINATCKQSTIAWEANQAAINAGVNIENYDRYLYALPNIGCPWSSQGSVGGSPSQSWFEGTLGLTGNIVHEVGHNFGLSHSGNLDCGSEVVGNNCSTGTYGDVLDIMGASRPLAEAHYNAFQKQRLGWLGFYNSPGITEVESSGSYDIEPYAQQTGGSKALRILREMDPVSGEKTWFFLEFRQAIGYDSWLTDEQYANNVLNGVTIHLGTEQDPYSSRLLDMNPNSQTYDWHDPALVTSQSFTDPESGITFTTEWTDENSATVSVDFGGGSSVCVEADPTVSLSPQDQTTPGGIPVGFNVTVTNNSNSFCDPVNFNLSTGVPANWSAVFANQFIQLAPGATGATNLTVTPSSTAGDGSYSITVTAEHANSPVYSSMDTAVVHVSNSGSGNSAPIANDDSGETQESVAITIDVLANDADPDGDELRVIQVTQGNKGSVSINSDWTVTYVPGRKAKGSDTFTYTITDGQSQSNAMVEIRFRKQTGGGRPGRGNK